MCVPSRCQAFIGQQTYAPGTTIGAALPAISGSYTDSYTGGQCTAQALEAPEPQLASVNYDANPTFFSPEQMTVLQAQPMPYDPFGADGGQNGALPLAAPVVVTATPTPALFTTSTGMPMMPMSMNSSSQAVTKKNGWSGVKSCDPRLQHSVEEVMSFLRTHNTKPRVACQVEGYHMEHRTRTVSDGNGGTRTEHYTERVVDFHYKIDLSNFVFPVGFIQSVVDRDGDGVIDSIPEIINDFISDSNKLKGIEMKKEIGFDFNALRGMVYGYIRQLGWWRGLSVTFPKGNYIVRIYSDNWVSCMWENWACFCLLHLTIVPCILLRMYRDCGGSHKQTGIRSFFQIQYSPLQVFETIKPALWCPGFHCTFGLELLRSCFW